MVKRLLEGNARHVQKRAKEISATASGQTPHSCFTTCADSRAPLHLIADATVGEVFTGPANAGNVVNPNDSAVRSTFEYAIRHLKVQHVGVMGHYRCGAIAALDEMHHLETGLQEHLTGLLPAKSIVDQFLFGKKVSQEEKRDLISEANVFSQLKNLRSIDVGGATIGELEKQGKLGVHALFYDVKTGELSSKPQMLEKFGMLILVKSRFS
ncbi:MAG: carbonic anhydrase [Candidatus Micrarchaeota archaeon]